MSPMSPMSETMTILVDGVVLHVERGRIVRPGIIIPGAPFQAGEVLRVTGASCEETNDSYVITKVDR